MKYAERMSRLGTETAFLVIARAKALEAQGHDIIHLEAGEPDFDTPEFIRTAGKKAIDDGWTKYTPANGSLDFRRTVAEEVSRTRGIDIDPEGVVITPGAKPIMFYTILALVDHGDEVICPNPGFPIYESMVNFAGGKPVPLPLLESKEFAFDINDLKQLVSDKTKMIIINSPHNPTGGMLSKTDFEGIAELARKHDCWILTDEIYINIVYEEEFASITNCEGMAERTIILDGFSKTYSMTGWRLGFGVMPVDLAKEITKLQINSNSCTAGFSQQAGIAALVGPQEESEKMIEEFKKRRDFFVDGLNSITGVRCLKPKGAFYVFPNIEGTGKSADELSRVLLEEVGVAGISGLAFGKYGKGYLRFSFVNSIENIEKALERIQQTVARF